MKANSYIKFTNIFNLIQLYFDLLVRSLFIGRIDVPKILVDRENTRNRQLQKTQLDRRHRSINWRWQSWLMQWL